MKPNRMLMLAAVTALWASPAWADKEAARAHYKEGQKLYDLGKFSDAAVQFEKGYELHSDPVFLFNLGQCYRQLGNTERALFFYRGFLRNKPDTPNRPQVEQLIADLEKAQETTTQPPVEAMPPDEQEPAQPTERPTESAPQPVAATETEAEISMPAAPPSDTQKWLAWGTVGVGVALITVGAVFGMQAKSAQDDAESGTLDNPLTLDEYNDAKDRGESKAMMANVFIGLGAAAAVGGGIWAYFAHQDSSSATAGINLDISDGVRVGYRHSF